MLAPQHLNLPPKLIAGVFVLASVDGADRGLRAIALRRDLYLRQANLQKVSHELLECHVHARCFNV